MEAFKGPRPPFAYKGSSSPHSAIQFKMSASLLWIPLLLAVISMTLARPTSKPWCPSDKQTLQEDEGLWLSLESNVTFLDKPHVDVASAEDKDKDKPCRKVVSWCYIAFCRFV